MNRVFWKRSAQLVVVVLSALALKFYYSTASANQLRWILAPTTFLVELISGTSFKFESHAGYLSSDRTFLIATSCAGVNFLITSFLMLSLRRSWRDRSRSIGWRFIPVAALLAYLATLVANTVRISTALQLRRMPLEISWLTGNQLHRFEGIFIYFGFLLLLFIVSEKLSSKNSLGFSSNAGGERGDHGLFRQSFFPLLVYYATTLGIPLANGAYHLGNVTRDFWEHLLFVLLTPLLLILPLATLRFFGLALRMLPMDRLRPSVRDGLAVWIANTSVLRMGSYKMVSVCRQPGSEGPRRQHRGIG
ncbi:MAG: exosortase K [Pyrinomonadaceae bacterium]|nr:exosortase K [Pyrinomonadaceae bacterium]